jgi:hypothetical protein
VSPVDGEPGAAAEDRLLDIGRPVELGIGHENERRRRGLVAIGWHETALLGRRSAAL